MHHIDASSERWTRSRTCRLITRSFPRHTLEIDKFRFWWHGWDKATGYLVAVVCRSKGATDAAAIRTVNRYLTEAGLTGTIELRSDSEMAARAARHAVATRRAPARTVVETTPDKSSNSLGGAERAIQTVTGVARTLCLAAEERYHMKITATSPLFTWLVQHASWLCNRFQPHLGKTPFERVRGRQYTMARSSPSDSRSCCATQR